MRGVTFGVIEQECWLYMYCVRKRSLAQQVAITNLCT